MLRPEQEEVIGWLEFFYQMKDGRTLVAEHRNTRGRDWKTVFGATESRT